MALYRRKRKSLDKMLRMPGALHRAVHLEVKTHGGHVSAVMFDALAERLSKSQVPEVRELITEFYNDEAALAAERDEREARRQEVRS